MSENPIEDMLNNPERWEKHLDDLMKRIRKQLKKSAEDSAKKFLDKHKV